LSLNRQKDKAIKQIKEEQELELLGKDIEANYDSKNLAKLKNENKSLSNSLRLIEEMKSTGTDVLSMLNEQKESHNLIQRRLLDIGTSLGLSDSTLRMIERRDFGDKLVGYLGMFIIIIILILIYYYKFYKR
jgi:Golgi SNAP receptor complex protein 2